MRTGYSKDLFLFTFHVKDPGIMGLNVLFVYPLPPPGPEVYPGFHHGIGSLSAVLKRHGHSTSLLAASACDPARVRSLLDDRQPDLVAVTSTSAEFPLARSLAGEIMKWRRVPLYFGGVHATAAPEEVTAVDGVQGICRGEGEQGLQLIVNGLEQGRQETGVPGFWIQKGEQWVRNPPGRITPLEDLPFPDREIFEYGEWIRPFSKIIGAEFLGSRGCPFRCSYCCTPLYSRLYAPETYWRRRAVEDLVSEVQNVTARYPTEIVGFHDDVFTLDGEWLEAFCHQYPEAVGKPFWCNTRVGCITEEQAGMLRRAGCVRIHVAVETGSPRLRREILGRNISDEEILETFDLLKRAGIKRLAFNMLGIPHETEETIRRTIALNRRIRPDRVHVTLFQPYPGTPLYDRCRKEGLLAQGAVSSYYDPATLVKNPGLPSTVLFRYLREFVPLVYGD